MQNKYERIVYSPSNPIASLVLAHGAGAGNQHQFIQNIASELRDKNIQVVCFNFPYMQQMYLQNKRKPPNRMPILLEHFKQEVQFAEQFDLPIFLAGKSMGGRAATLLNTSALGNIKGVIVYGYPFIPPGKPEKLEERTVHFRQQQSPLMILQGERDSFGNKTFMSDTNFPNIDITWIEDGDHSFKPRKSSAATFERNLAESASLSEQFILKIVNDIN